MNATIFCMDDTSVHLSKDERIISHEQLQVWSQQGFGPPPWLQQWQSSLRDLPDL